MYANSFQSGFISIFYSIGSNPLSQWDKAVKNGHIRRVIDDEVKSLVLEISGTNVATTYITCPIKPRASLGIRLPFLVMVVKNMKKYFTFEIQILDDKDMRRRFRVSNFQSSTKVRPFCTTMPIGLSSGWNQIQFNLADFTRRAYGTVYIETVRVQIHANVRVRRLYFSDRLYSEEDLPSEYKLFLPLTSSQTKKIKTVSKEKMSSKPTKGVGDQKISKEPAAAPPTPTDKPEESKPERQPSVNEDKITIEATIGESVTEEKPEFGEDLGEGEEDIGEGYEEIPEEDAAINETDEAIEGYETDEFEGDEGEAPPPSEN